MAHSFLIALLTCLPLGGSVESPARLPLCAQAQEARLPALDAELQKAIALVMRGDAAGTPAARRAELDRLESLAGQRYARLIPQLLLFSRGAKSTREAMAFGAIVSRLRIADADVLGALVPLLEVPDESLQLQLRGYLSEYEGAGVGRRPSFAHYRDFLSLPKAKGDPLPAGLLRYLYARDPGQALLLLMSVMRAAPAERRELMWAEHRIADVLWQEEFGFRERGTPDEGAGRELNRMALHSAWCARYFAAEMLATAPHLGQRAWLEALGEDPDLRVRAAAKRALQQR